MNILIIFIDKVSHSAIQNLIDDYFSRIKHYCNVSMNTISVPKNVRYKSIEEQKQEEEKLIFKHIKTNDYVVLLDEKGKEMISIEFSKWLGKKLESSKRMVLIVGGPYGFTERLKKSYESVSLSKMTFSHEIVRIVLMEQLYRAFTILKGQKYHHE